MVRIRDELKEAGNKLEVLAITVDGTSPKMVIGQPRTTPMLLTKVQCGPTNGKGGRHRDCDQSAPST